MARVRFLDENNKQGEVDIAKVKVGDIAKFKADFIKHGEGDEDDTEKKVLGGELAEVLDVFPDMPGLLVEAPCELTGMGGRILGESEFMVEPESIVLVLDSRDPRISSSRVMDAALELPELESHVRGLRLPEVCRGRRDVVIAALVRADLRKVAHFVAETDDEAWLSFAEGAALVKTAWVSPQDWAPLIIWSIEAFKDEYPGEKGINIKNKNHVVWALEKNAADLKGMLPGEKLDWEEEDEYNAQLVEDMLEMAEQVKDMDHGQWQSLLPDLVGIMGDDDLLRYYETMVGVPSDYERFLEEKGEQPPPPKGFGEVLEGLEGAGVEIPEMLEPHLPAQEPATPHVLEAPHEEPKGPPLYIPESTPPHLRPGPTYRPPSEVDQERKEEERSHLRVVPDPPPLPETPSKYDVSMTDVGEGEPHGWASTEVYTPGPEIERLPIPVYKGFPIPEGHTGGPRSFRVWAYPEMLVENRKTGETGQIVGFEPGDIVKVTVLPEEGVPDLDQEPVAWDIVDVKLSPKWQEETETVDAQAFRDWREERNRRKTKEYKREKRDKAKRKREKKDGHQAHPAREGGAQHTSRRAPAAAAGARLSSPQGRTRPGGDVHDGRRGVAHGQAGHPNKRRGKADAVLGQIGRGAPDRGAPASVFLTAEECLTAE
jgi:hypothetical protein